MLFGHGIDVVHLPRIRTLLCRRDAERFARRILSDAELVGWRALQLSGIEAQVKYLAVRWSLKESVYKALYPRFSPAWKDFTYRSADRHDRLKPTLVCNSKQIAQSIGPVHASVSHDGDYVFTSVIVEATCCASTSQWSAEGRSSIQSA